MNNVLRGAGTVVQAFGTDEVKPFPDFKSDAYDEAIPSVSHIRRCLLKFHEAHHEYHNKRNQLVTGSVISVDQSYYSASLTASPIDGVIFITHEFSEIMNYPLAMTSRNLEMTEWFKQIEERNRRLAVSVAFTDNAKKDATSLKECFPGLQTAGKT